MSGTEVKDCNFYLYYEYAPWDTNNSIGMTSVWDFGALGDTTLVRASTCSRVFWSRAEQPMKQARWQELDEGTGFLRPRTNNPTFANILRSYNILPLRCFLKQTNCGTHVGSMSEGLCWTKVCSNSLTLARADSCTSSNLRYQHPPPRTQSDLLRRNAMHIQLREELLSTSSNVRSSLL